MENKIDVYPKAFINWLLWMNNGWKLSEYEDIWDHWMDDYKTTTTEELFNWWSINVKPKELETVADNEPLKEQLIKYNNFIIENDLDVHFEGSVDMYLEYLAKENGDGI